MDEELNGTLEEIKDIDDNFKRVLFAEWIEGNDKNFQSMRKKLQEKIESQSFTKKIILENTIMNNDNITKMIGDLITPVKLNDTTKLNVAIPSQVRNVLFDDWEELGIDFVRILSQYTKNLELDINLYVGQDKIVFHPPVPTYDKSRGFIYKNWSKNYYMFTLTFDILEFKFISSAQIDARSWVYLHRPMKKFWNKIHRWTRNFWIWVEHQRPSLSSQSLWWSSVWCLPSTLSWIHVTCSNVWQEEFTLSQDYPVRLFAMVNSKNRWDI